MAAAATADASTSRQQQLPPSLIPVSPIKLISRWQPKTHLEPPRPYPPDVERMNEPDLIPNPAQMPGAPELMRNPKKVRPRRTVDYNGGLTRWRLLRKMRPNPTYIPYLRPSPTYIINLLPPKAYLNNSSTSICTKFVHTSTNKIKFPVNVVAWTPEGRRVLTGSTSGEFTLWNGLTFNFETILQAHDTAIRAFQFAHNGSYLISADQSGIIKYFQPNMNNLVMWNGHREPIRGVTFSPDDQRFATASDDQTIKLWDFQTRTEERTFTGHGWDVRCVEWHPTKGLLASGSKDNLVKFWDPRTGQQLSTLHYHKGTVQAIQWNPNGDTLATASRDQTIRVFDIRAMKELQLFKGHKKDVCSIAWHPIHHDLLASGGAEGSIIYWTVGYSTPRATIEQAHDSNVWALAWHPLGYIICSGSNDYTVRFWSRDRPGDTSNKGEKPPAAGARDGEDDEDESYVPGLQGGGGGFGGGRDDYDGPAWNPDRRNNAQTDNFIPGLGGSSRVPPPQVEEPAAPAMQAQIRTQWNGPTGGGGGGGYGRGGREDYDDRNRGGYDYGERRGGFGGRGGRGGGGVGNGVRRDDRTYGRY